MGNNKTNNNKTPQLDSTDRCNSFFITLSYNCLDDALKEKAHEEMCKDFLNIFKKELLNYRASAISLCESEAGYLHLHIVCETSKATRWSTIKNLLPKANIAATKGNKKQVLDYLYKRGAYEIKGEKILCVEMDGNILGRQGYRSDLQDINARIRAGATPTDLFQENIANRKYEKLIKGQFIDFRKQCVGRYRDVTFEWHAGKTASGKSWVSNEYEEEDIYITNTYRYGWGDMYEAQAVLMLDEYRNDNKLPISEILSITDHYARQFSCRFHNSYMLWNKVIVCSPTVPSDLYTNLGNDSQLHQLYRRLNKLIYHYVYKDDNDNLVYCQHIADNVQKTLPELEREMLETNEYFKSKIQDGYIIRYNTLGFHYEATLPNEITSFEK